MTLYISMVAHLVPPPNIFPTVISFLFKMSHHYLRYLRHGQDSSSDDENEEDFITTLHSAQTQHEHISTPRWGGSMLGCEYVHRNREAAHRTLYSDYFSENPTYGPTFFRRRFAISPLSYLFLVFQFIFLCSFLYWCLFAHVSDVSFSLSSYSGCYRGT
jgi:hypothetical protein